jgi:hypothetical protein
MIVNEGRTEIIVPHGGKELKFIYPPVGPGSFSDTGLAITGLNLSRPTLSEIISLIHAAYNEPNQAYSKKIINLLKNNLIWGFTALDGPPVSVVGGGTNGRRYSWDNPIIIGPRSYNAYNEIGMEVFGGAKFIYANPLSERFPYGFTKIKKEEISGSKLLVSLIGKEATSKLEEITDIIKRPDICLRSEISSGDHFQHHAPFFIYENGGLELCAHYSNNYRAIAFGVDRGQG